jgi:hypothetical protein
MRRARSLALAAVGVPVLVVALVLVFDVGRSSSAACDLDEFPEQPGGHAAARPDGFDYNSSPPTSGPSADRPLVWGAYDEPVSQFRLVHNLLHGGVAVQYGDGVSTDDVAAIRTWYFGDPDGVVVAPLPALGDRIALTAWTRKTSCGAFRRRTFDSFRTRYRFNGPERPPRETMRPGRGGAPNPLGLRVTPRSVRDEATLTFVYGEAANVSLEIRKGTVSGPVVRHLANISLLPATRVRLAWDGRDDAGRLLAPGTYVAFARVLAGDRRVTASTAFNVR